MMENIGCTLIILFNMNGAAVLSDAGGAPQENKVTRVNEHVAETSQSWSRVVRDLEIIIPVCRM